MSGTKRRYPCPIYWITTEAVQVVAAGHLILWRCAICDRWHYHLTRNQTMHYPLTLECSYHCSPTVALGFEVTRWLPNTPLIWWLCGCCHSWHLYNSWRPAPRPAPDQMVDCCPETVAAIIPWEGA